ncbi:MAG: Gfo/Idh/MocA family oxidoreductase [Eubacteriales bacterium]|nr:Gfo/Idh/MocA family oxidoreductase [Eubacteriales bacterium]
MENSGAKFRFAVMGAGGIANKFCDAVRELDESGVCGAEVVAVASKSAERAQSFADRNGIPAAYDSYEEMLQKEKPDGVYIAVLPNDHYRLTMLCLDYRTPVLCEKAMFMNSAEAKEVFARSKELGIFVMEAMWSRFLPALQQAKRWIEEGRIGTPRVGDAMIGFRAPDGAENRYHKAEHGGGAAHDILVYAYEIMTWMITDPVQSAEVSVLWEETGSDLTDHVILRFPQATASLTATFAAPVETRLIVGGDQGMVVLPSMHYASEAFLYDVQGRPVEHFIDSKTKNGFIYEIREMIECVRAGKIQSETVPHSCTIACSELFDQVAQAK